MRAATLFLPVALMFTGCAAATSDVSTPRSVSSEISFSEIAAFTGDDALQLIQRTRPLWLRTRGVVSLYDPEGMAVYLDGVRLGGLEQLRSVSVRGLTRVVQHSAPHATLYFGTGHPHGAIELITSHRVGR